MDIRRVTNQNSGKAMIIAVNDKLTLKNLMKRRRQKVIELIRQFNKVYHTHGIVVSLLNQKRRLERGPAMSHGNTHLHRGERAMTTHVSEGYSAYGFNQETTTQPDHEQSDRHSYSQIFGKREPTGNEIADNVDMDIPRDSQTSLKNTSKMVGYQ